MGGGGGGYYSSFSPKELQANLEQAAETVAAEFEPELQAILNSILPEINDRDSQADSKFKDDIKSIVSEAINSPLIGMQLGGSVSKNTYVEGLSDVDALAIFRKTLAGETTPQSLLEKMSSDLRRELPDCEIKTGRVAVTIVRPNGSEFQIIPAVKKGAKLAVPSWDGERWSRINTRAFSKALTMYNQRMGGKLVPTIKLAKKVIAQLPQYKQLSGYHVESIAVEVFKSYNGPYTTAAMLPRFFEKASSAVLSPIKDRSGQSRHVDEYLGAQNSVKRKEVSHLLTRVWKRMSNASAFGSKVRWKSILGED